MVNRLIMASSNEAKTDYPVSGNCIFVSNGLLSPAGLIENVAQTCAAYMGYLHMKSGNKTDIDYIGSIKNFEVKRLPRTDEIITTRIELLEKIFNMALVSAIIKVDEIEVATTDMTIASGNVVTE